jgi:hypothetical protein
MMKPYNRMHILPYRNNKVVCTFSASEQTHLQVKDPQGISNTDVFIPYLLVQRTLLQGKAQDMAFILSNVI